MSDTLEGFAPQTDGDDEVVIPAPTAITAYIGALTASGEPEVGSRLIVGWNGEGSPVVMGDNGALRLLDDDEIVTDVAWGRDA
jgi:hypothetical protein